MSSEETACANEELIAVVEDIAMLARQFAEKEPFKSASGPEALRAPAIHLDGMVARIRAGEAPSPFVQVPVVRSGRPR